MAEDPQLIFNIHLQEYAQLKQEQRQRIGLRDNLLYFTLGVYVAILGFAVGEQGDPYALLVLPWVSLILGWTYLVNDQKITAIGRYIRGQLTTKICKAVDANTDIESVLTWEIAHRSDANRKRRKVEQLIVDLVAFVLSGVAALVAFRYFYTTQLASDTELIVNGAVRALWWVELILLLGLGFEILQHVDWLRGR
jgi:hypothetical protein